MDISRFLSEELKAIDSKILESQTNSFIKFEYESLDLIKLLRHSASEKVVYYESKDEDFALLGLGISKYVEKEDVHSNSTPLFMQGFFEEAVEHNQCVQFEWTFVNREQKTTLYIHPNRDRGAFSLSLKIFNDTYWESFVSPWASYEETPEHDEWASMINSAHELFDSGSLDKIVLSRKKVFKYADPIDSLHMFEELYKANKNSSHFTLYNQTNPQDIFVSFSPEKLFSLKGNKLETLSLAGSLPRGETPELDEENYLLLKNTARLIHEQSTVTNEIKFLLEKVCDDVHVSDLKIMKLPYIFHRQNDITGTLKSNVAPLDLVKLLHPTPAVGGYPRDQVGPYILKIEKTKREHYAAPFGILSKELSEFAVGIRSAKIEDDKITVYGGAGIVTGSIAEDEWQETGTKMKPFLKVINQSL